MSYESPLLNSPETARFPDFTVNPNSASEFNAIQQLGKLLGDPRLAEQIARGLGEREATFHIASIAQNTTQPFAIPVVRGMKVEYVMVRASAMSGTCTANVLVDSTSITSTGSALGLDEGSTAWQLLTLDEDLVDIDAPDVDGTYDKHLVVQLITGGTSTFTNGQAHVVYRIK